ncbi:hypothetical protein BASA81_002385 [Batrachochytrium salamandrivorans]|nr:hypothetical protein BASA81_002385 [Batrachochytrium salamandrivorans]
MNEFPFAGIVSRKRMVATSTKPNPVQLADFSPSQRRAILFGHFCDKLSATQLAKQLGGEYKINEVAFLLDLCQKPSPHELDRVALLHKYNLYVEPPRKLPMTTMLQQTWLAPCGIVEGANIFRHLPAHEREHWERETVRNRARYVRECREKLRACPHAEEFKRERFLLVQPPPISFYQNGKRYVWRDMPMLENQVRVAKRTR